MAPTFPLLVASHTVRGTCTVGIINDGGSSATITVPEGVYWTDPLIGFIGSPFSGTVDLAGQIGYLIDQAITPDTISAAYTLSAEGIAKTAWDYDSGTGSTAFRPAGANTEGLRIYPRIGASRSATSTGFSATYEAGIVHGVWGPETRPERDMASWAQGALESMTVVNRGFDGATWAHSVGQPLRRRTMRFELVPAAYARNETGLRNIGQGSIDNDTTFETLMWRYLSDGEMVRVYSDRNATVRYLTSAMTATATTAAVSGSGAGLSDGETIWIDGEECYIISGGGTSTLTLDRPNPVAHPIYAPVSDAHVATYVLDNDGGNAGIGLLDLTRRAYNNPRYDIEIPLVETRWE